MRQLHASFGQQRAPALAGWLLLAIALIFAGWAAQAFLQSTDQHQSAMATQARYAEERQRRHDALAQASSQSTQNRYLQDKRWQHALKDLGVPWLLTLHALEQASRPPVFLTGIRSDPSSGRVQIDAEAPSLTDALTYVQALQQAPPLHQVWLLRHEEAIDASSGRSALRFAVQA